MGNSMTVKEPASQQVESLDTEMRFAKAVANSSVVPEAYRGDPGSVLVAINYGASMGLLPAESLYRVNVIYGKPTMSGELIASQVRKAGHRLRIRKDEKNMSVTATIVRADDPDFEFSVTRDMQWVKDMGFYNNPKYPNYKKQPMTMLMWRAVSAVAREACPEALYGAGYTPEEVKDSAADDDVEYTVEDDCNHADRLERVKSILVDGGVRNDDDVRLVLSEFTGRNVAKYEELSDDEVDNLLVSRQFTLGRVKNVLALTEKAKTDEAAPAPYTLKDVEAGFAHIGCTLKDAQPAIENVVGHKVPDPHKLTPAEIDNIMYDLKHSEVKQ